MPVLDESQRAELETVPTGASTNRMFPTKAVMRSVVSI